MEQCGCMASDQLRVARNGEELEQITFDQLDAKLSSGELLPSDWGLKDGESAWTQLYIVAGERLIEFSALDPIEMQTAIEKEYESTEELVERLSGEVKELSLKAKDMQEQKKNSKRYLVYLQKLEQKALRAEERAEREQERAEEEAEKQAEIAEYTGYIKKAFDMAKQMDAQELMMADSGIDPDTDGTMSEKAIEKAYQKIWEGMRAVEPTDEELVEMGRANAESLGDDAFYIISDYLKKKSPRP